MIYTENMRDNVRHSLMLLREPGLLYMSNLEFFCQIRLLCPENIDKMLKLSLLAADKADVTWQRFIELNIENLYQIELILCYLQFIQL